MRLISDFALAVVTIRQEAEGEPYAGKIAVGEVIRNLAKRHGKTIAAVVLEPMHFSGWNGKNQDGSSNLRRIVTAMSDDTDPIVRDCANAWLASETSTLTENATLYVNPDIAQPDWISRVTPTVRIGHHQFFRE